MKLSLHEKVKHTKVTPTFEAQCTNRVLKPQPLLKTRVQKSHPLLKTIIQKPHPPVKSNVQKPHPLLTAIPSEY